MYYSLTGKTVIKENFVVVTAGGVGYRVYTSSSTISRLKNNQEATLYTFLSVKEDSLTIFGFDTEEELSTFKMLIGVSGVCPKAAVSILSALTPAEFALSVASNDPKAITKAQGVGKRLAEKIIVELKDKLKSVDLAEIAGDSQANASGFSDSYVTEAVNALMVLGYSAVDAKKVVDSVRDKADNLEDLIKLSLKKISRL